MKPAPSEVFTDDELVANPILVHIAGHETASGAACLALTTLQAIPEGEELVACALASPFETLARRGGGHVYIDGHVTDPQRAGTRPHSARDANPVDLIEIG